MQKVIVSGKYSGKRIDRFLRDIYSNAPSGAIFKALRKKDIKVNGVRVKEDYTVAAGDTVEVFITDDILNGTPHGSNINKGFLPVYEDQNILIVNKEQGIPVHPDRDQASGTLIDNIQAYLKEKGEYRPENPSSFAPALCHRLDRNTGGLLLIAKNAQSLEILLDKIKTREVKKYYQCLVSGQMNKISDTLQAYLEKDERKSRVFIRPDKTPSAQEIITRYRVLSFENGISRLEVELVTGRTHQIRAHLAYIGHPIIGDGKYGLNSINRPLGANIQALWACKIRFDFKEAGRLNYLKGRSFEVEPDFKVNAGLQHL